VKVQQFLYKPGQTLRVPGGSVPQISRHSANEGGEVVSLMHRPPLTPGNTPGAHFCQRLSRPQGYSATGRIMSMKNSNCIAVPEPTALPRASCHQFLLVTIYLRRRRRCVPNTSDITLICLFDSRPTEHPWRPTATRFAHSIHTNTTFCRTAHHTFHQNMALTVVSCCCCCCHRHLKKC
jgi:hypothetical protein